MYIYIYTYIYICVCMCVRACLYVRVYAYVCVQHTPILYNVSIRFLYNTLTLTNIMKYFQVILIVSCVKLEVCFN